MFQLQVWSKYLESCQWQVRPKEVCHRHAQFPMALKLLQLNSLEDDAFAVRSGHLDLNSDFLELFVVPRNQLLVQDVCDVVHWMTLCYLHLCLCQNLMRKIIMLPNDSHEDKCMLSVRRNVTHYKNFMKYTK